MDALEMVDDSISVKDLSLLLQNASRAGVISEVSAEILAEMIASFVSSSSVPAPSAIADGSDESISSMLRSMFSVSVIAYSLGGMLLLVSLGSLLTISLSRRKYTFAVGLSTAYTIALFVATIKTTMKVERGAIPLPFGYGVYLLGPLTIACAHTILLTLTQAGYLGRVGSTRIATCAVNIFMSVLLWFVLPNQVHIALAFTSLLEGIYSVTRRPLPSPAPQTVYINRGMMMALIFSVAVVMMRALAASSYPNLAEQLTLTCMAFFFAIPELIVGSVRGRTPTLVKYAFFALYLCLILVGTRGSAGMSGVSLFFHQYEAFALQASSSVVMCGLGALCIRDARKLSGTAFAYQELYHALSLVAVTVACIIITFGHIVCWLFAILFAICAFFSCLAMVDLTTRGGMERFSSTLRQNALALRIFPFGYALAVFCLCLFIRSPIALGEVEGQESLRAVLLHMALLSSMVITMVIPSEMAGRLGRWVKMAPGYSLGPGLRILSGLVLVLTLLILTMLELLDPIVSAAAQMGGKWGKAVASEIIWELGFSFVPFMSFNLYSFYYAGKGRHSLLREVWYVYVMLLAVAGVPVGEWSLLTGSAIVEESMSPLARDICYWLSLIGVGASLAKLPTRAQPAGFVSYFVRVLLVLLVGGVLQSPLLVVGGMLATSALISSLLKAYVSNITAVATALGTTGVALIVGTSRFGEMMAQIEGMITIFKGDDERNTVITVALALVSIAVFMHVMFYCCSLYLISYILDVIDGYKKHRTMLEQDKLRGAQRVEVYLNPSTWKVGHAISLATEIDSNSLYFICIPNMSPELEGLLRSHFGWVRWRALAWASYHPLSSHTPIAKVTSRDQVVELTFGWLSELLESMSQMEASRRPSSLQLRLVGVSASLDVDITFQDR